MDTSPLRLLTQSLLFLSNFLDDAILLGLSRFGYHFAWLQWIAPLMFGLTLLVWATQLLKAPCWKGWRET